MLCARLPISFFVAFAFCSFFPSRFLENPHQWACDLDAYGMRNGNVLLLTQLIDLLLHFLVLPLVSAEQSRKAHKMREIYGIRLNVAKEEPIRQQSGELSRPSNRAQHQR